MHARVDEFARPVTLELGKRIDEVLLSADIIDCYAKDAEHFFAPQHLTLRADEAEVERSPIVVLANDGAFGSRGAVFTKNVARSKRVASRIDTGMMFVNQPTWTTPDVPFGGIRNAGYGRELSGLGTQEFVNTKLVCVASRDASA